MMTIAMLALVAGTCALVHSVLVSRALSRRIDYLRERLEMQNVRIHSLENRR